MSEPKVLIAGAGPTGLVLALWLAKAGVPLRLIDRKAGPGEGSRAMVVHARTLEFYRQLGIAEAAVARGARLDRLRLRDRHREMAVLPFGAAGKGLGPFPFVLSLPQDDHERLLFDLLREAGAAVEWGTELVGLTQDAAGVRASLRSPTGESAWSGEYVCGCDGAHSAVRHALGVGFPGGTYDQLFYVADAEAQGDWCGNDVTAFIAEKTFCLSFPVRNQGAFRFLGLVPEALRGKEGLSFDDLRPEVERVTRTRVGRVNWFSTYRVHHRVAEAFRRGRAFLSGDAGHVHSPAGGQGMNTGIGDAVNLAWKLAAVLKGRGPAELLDTYEAERLPFARSLVATTDRVFEAAVGSGWLPRAIRAVVAPFVLPLAMQLAAVRRLQFRVVSQTRIAYHPSPLSDGSAGAVRAGDRLPWVQGPDNYGPMTSRDWQVHVYGRADAAARSAASAAGVPLHEWPWGAAARRAGFAEGAAYVVRPDGHVGAARLGADGAGLRTYLARWVG